MLPCEFKGINIVCAPPGRGKTSFMAFLAGEFMTTYAYDSLLRTNAKIEKFNAGGYHFSNVLDHTVYTNFNVKSHVQWFPDQVAHDMDGFEFGLPDPEHPTKFVPPGSYLFFMEAQSFLDARRFKDFRESVSRAYEFHRHWGVTIFLDAQRGDLIDLNVRALATVWEVQDLVVKKDTNDNVVKCTWIIRRFDGLAEYSAYATSGSGKYQTLKFVYTGDIFANYDSECEAALFLEGRENADFYLGHHEICTFSIESVKAYCANHSLNNLAKLNYYKGAKKCKNLTA